MTHPPTAAPSGRRARKRAQTKEALRTAARRLFAAQGFVATTVEQITDAADVSERTFFRYFESKEDLLLSDLPELFAAVESRLLERPVEEHPLDAYVEALAAEDGVLAAQRDAGELADALGLPADMVLGRLVRALVAWEDRLADVLAQRARIARPEADPGEVLVWATVTSSIAVSATRGALRLIGLQPDSTPEQRLATLRTAFDLVRSGCPVPQRAAA